ncbi:polymorphic toxin type 50 domain-containing protein, partial [Psychromicrobium sp. YIM B11713]|uniref:polymorphic toxin type 50 domain-containing protein n=1 Tax=Psychromicrobium sp. YIM B11713 TaxID=3145233 RepID=UPI00374E7BA4
GGAWGNAGGKIAGAEEQQAASLQAAKIQAAKNGAQQAANGPGLPAMVHWGQQAKHFPGHPNYGLGKGIITENPEKLADYLGSGNSVGNALRGQPGFRERIDFGFKIGSFSDKDGELLPTTVGIVHL